MSEKENLPKNLTQLQELGLNKIPSHSLTGMCFVGNLEREVLNVNSCNLMGNSYLVVHKHVNKEIGPFTVSFVLLNRDRFQNGVKNDVKNTSSCLKHA